MLSRIVELKEPLAVFAAEEDITNWNIQTSILEKVISALSPFQNATDKFWFCSAADVIPTVRWLNNMLSNNVDAKGIGSFVESLQSKMDVKFGNLETIDEFAIATFIDPRYKEKFFVKAGTMSNIVETLKLLISNGNEQNDFIIQIPTPSKKPRVENKREVGSFNDFVASSSDDEDDSRNVSGDMDYIDKEINLYLKNMEIILPEEDPLSWWHQNKILELDDTRGRTPLCLAIVLQNVECVKLLIDAGADAGAISKDFWSVINEATCTGSRDLLGLCLKYRDYQEHRRWCRLASEILEKLSRSTDFYVEMKWEFHSWVPFVSKMCPSDVYKIYKRGRNLRFDTTLVGFENNQWKRGRQTFIFKASSDGANAAQFCIIDHDARTIFNEFLEHDVSGNSNQQYLPEPQNEVLDALLKSPVSTFYVDLEDASFERKQEGLFGWFAEKVEAIGGYECKVYKIANVNAVTKTRIEHLDYRMREQYEQSKKSNLTSLESWFHWLQGSETKISTTADGDLVTSKEYFSKTKDVGKPREGTASCRNFEANLYLSENYPLSLIEQVLPIVDIISSTNPHFAKLKDFLTLQLPAGFPVKIEIPIFHVLNAVVTFDNVHSEKRLVDGVTFLSDAKNKFCALDDDLFAIPTDYVDRNLTSERQNWVENEEMAMLMFALRDSMNNGNVQSDVSINQENDEITLQRAIDESIRSQCSQSASFVNENNNINISNNVNDGNHDLALQMSQQEEEHRILLQHEEATQLEEILRKSLIER